MHKQNYERQGRRLPVDEMLTFDDEKNLGEFLKRMDTLLSIASKGQVTVFEVNSTKSLKETIYSAFVQGKFIFIECMIIELDLSFDL